MISVGFPESRVVSQCREDESMDSEDITIRRITSSGYKCLDVTQLRPSAGSVKRGDIARSGVAIITRACEANIISTSSL